MARRSPGASPTAAGPLDHPPAVPPDERPAERALERGPGAAVALLDAGGRVTLWSRGAERLTGVPAVAALGRPLDFLYPSGGADDGTAEQHLERAARARRLTTVGSRVLADGASTVRMSLVTLADGRNVRGFAMILASPTSPAGRTMPEDAVRAAVATSAELGRLARVPRARRTDAGFGSDTLRAAFDLATDAIVVTDEYGMLVGVNTAAGQLLGLADRAVPRLPIFAFVPVNSRVAIRRLLLRLRTEATVTDEELMFRAPEGPPVRVRATATLGHASEPVGTIVYWTLRRVQDGPPGGGGARARPHLLVAALEEERLRLSREIHDVLGQSLTALSLEVKALESIARGPGARERVARVRALVASTSEQAHEIARSLRPTGLADLGLVRALDAHLKEWELRAGVVTDFLATGMEGRLPEDVEIALYRVAQEALTNVARHAQATRVSVVLERTAWQVMLVLDDDGRGFDDGARRRPGSGLGLLGARERIALVGGTLSVETTRGSGTSVFARVPLDGTLRRRVRAQVARAASSERKAP